MGELSATQQGRKEATQQGRKAVTQHLRKEAPRQGSNMHRKVQNTCSPRWKKYKDYPQQMQTLLKSLKAAKRETLAKEAWSDLFCEVEDGREGGLDLYFKTKI